MRQEAIMHRELIEDAIELASKDLLELAISSNWSQEKLAKEAIKEYRLHSK